MSSEDTTKMSEPDFRRASEASWARRLGGANQAPGTPSRPRFERTFAKSNAFKAAESGGSRSPAGGRGVTRATSSEMRGARCPSEGPPGGRCAVANERTGVRLRGARILPPHAVCQEGRIAWGGESGLRIPRLDGPDGLELITPSNVKDEEVDQAEGFELVARLRADLSRNDRADFYTHEELSEGALSRRPRSGPSWYARLRERAPITSEGSALASTSKFALPWNRAGRGGESRRSSIFALNGRELGDVHPSGGRSVTR